MIDIGVVEKIHDLLIKRFGGARGIRDLRSLESAIARPFQRFDEKESYPDPIDKAAAIFESLISNHPFIDGNKRTAYVLMRLILQQHQLDIVCTQSEKYDFVMDAASGKLSFEEIKFWIRKNLK